MPRSAFLDTTILADLLLKPAREGRAARQLLDGFSETLLPQYAIKEFKAGALRNVIWFYNKLISCAVYSDAIAAIPLLWMQSNKMLTAMRAMADFESSIGKELPDQLAKKYPGQTEDIIRKAEAQLWLKTLIFRAWRRRRKVATHVVAPLSCYREIDPELRSSGVIDDRPVRCETDDCCLRRSFGARADDLKCLIDACDQQAARPEIQKRRKALRRLNRFPDRELSETDCIALGDAVFALQCPQNSIIVTTNVRDHEPLANALGIQIVSP
jgi:hypothetical protein